jgi:hypothetical protein
VRTVVIRITEPKKGGAFPVELLSGDPGSPLKLVAGTKVTLPGDLAAAAAVTDPAGGLLTAARAREIYAGAEPADELAVLGEFMYRLLARGKLAQAWARLRDEAPPEGTRTLLDIGSGPACRALHDLPWERMYDPQTGAHLFLEPSHLVLRGEARAVEEANPLVRAAARKHLFPQDDWPLRVLVVFGASPDFAQGKGVPGGIGASRELQALESLFASSRFDVDCEVLEHPLPAEIVDKCEKVQPHILHFIGHAEADGAPQNHRLRIWRPAVAGAQAGYLDWALHDVRNDLQAQSPPRLAFLNACRTAAAGNGGAASPGSPFASIAEAFLNLGALGVIGMQGDVPGDIAAEYARVFYQAAIAGDPVDLAATKARRAAARVRPDLVKRCAWSFPVLRTRVLPQLVLPQRPSVPGEATFLERFVSQVSQRRVVRDAVRNRLALEKAGSSPHLVAIVGEEDAGKSHLAKWCAQICARGGPRAVYVPFGDHDSLDIVDALRCIRDGQRPVPGRPPERVPTWPLGAEPFRRFTWELNHRLRGVTMVPAPADGDVVADEGTRLKGDSRPDEGFFAGVLGQFRLALEEAARPNGLLVVLDQISKVQEAHLEPLIGQLLRHVAAGSVKGVRMIVVARTEEFEQRLKALREGTSGATVVEVGYFQANEFERVARQLCLQWAPDRFGLLQPVLPGILAAANQKERWKAGVLRRVDDICRALEPKRGP